MSIKDGKLVSWTYIIMVSYASCNFSSMDMLELRRLKMKLTKFSFKTDLIFRIISSFCARALVVVLGWLQRGNAQKKTIAPLPPARSRLFTGLILIDDFWKYTGAQLRGIFFTTTELRHHFTRSFAIRLQEW